MTNFKTFTFAIVLVSVCATSSLLAQLSSTIQTVPFALAGDCVLNMQAGEIGDIGGFEEEITFGNVGLDMFNPDLGELVEVRIEIDGTSLNDYFWEINDHSGWEDMAGDFAVGNQISLVLDGFAWVKSGSASGGGSINGESGPASPGSFAAPNLDGESIFTTDIEGFIGYGVVLFELKSTLSANVGGATADYGTASAGVDGWFMGYVTITYYYIPN